MATARRSQICLEETQYYHCISRCVRRAFLCGNDKFTTKNFDHRKGWIVKRIKQLASIFAIDIAAYAVMSNHYHVVLYVNRDKALAWDDQTVLKQWTLLCKPKPVVERWLSGNIISQSDNLIIQQCVTEYRQRLTDISWFMRFLNEHVARLANEEDNCTGRFWEGRFKSQALLDETALLACMAYVDLNPIRANITDSLETSDYTSIQERMGLQPEPQTNPIPAGENNLNDNQQNKKQQDETTNNPPQDRLASIPLAPLQCFAGHSHIDNDKQAIQHELINYLALVDWTSRQIHPNKRGKVASEHPSILTTLNITEDNWLAFSNQIEQDFSQAIGAETRLHSFGRALHKKRHRGVGKAKRYYAIPAALTSA
ncbi:transposase [Saccharobesus litoralis]|uniref:transposase n=1 Tax=Saccharobesus litoralis TaxID=2172099 RepID=UPI001E3F1729|nr:transposase [Saccharobesus litoralis]